MSDDDVARLCTLWYIWIGRLLVFLRGRVETEVVIHVW